MRETAITLGYQPPPGLTRPPHRFTTLLRGTNKRVPDNAPPAPAPDYQSPFDNILQRSLAWQEDTVVRAPQIAVGMSAKVESILREEDAPGYESDGSDDLNTLRSQYAHAFSMMGMTRGSAKQQQGPSSAVPAPGTQRPLSAALHQHSIPDARSPPKQATTKKSASQQTLGNQTLEPSVAGWVETGRYGAGVEAGEALAAQPAPQHAPQGIEAHGGRMGDVEDEDQLAIAFKSLQERIHMTMSSSHLQSGAKHTVLAVPHHTMASPNSVLQHVNSVHGQGAVGGSPAAYAQGRSDARHEAFEAASATERGSPAGASTLRAGTTRRQIAQAYDHDYDVSGGGTAFQGRGGEGGRMGAAGGSSVGAEGRQDMFGGDGKLWEQSSSVIRQQFASLYSALSQQQYEDLSQQRPASGGQHVQVVDPKTDPRGGSDKVSLSTGKPVAAGAKKRGGQEEPHGRDDELAASGLARDGITTSMTDLRREIEATAHQYHTNKAAMQARRASRPLRAEQRKAAGRLITQREKDAREVRKGRDDWEAESKGRTWAARLKDMHKLVKDLEPLVDMAASSKTAVRTDAAPALAKRQGPAPHAVSATRPKTAGGSRNSLDAPHSGRPLSAGGGGARYDSAMGALPASFAKGSARVEAWSQQPQARFEAWGAGAGWERDLGEGVSQSEEQSGGQGADSEANVSLYARDEAIGARPRTRRGRGMLTRDSVAVDDQSSSSHQHLMEAVPVADDEMSGAANGGGRNMSQHDSDGDEGYIVPKRDEAIGARPPTRRGRPDPPRRAPAGEPKGYDGAAVDGGEAGREIFSDCTTPDAPDGIDADDGAWKRANGMNGNGGGAEILRLSGSDLGGRGRSNLEDDDSSEGAAADEDDGMWQKQEYVLKMMLDRQEQILRRSQELAARGASGIH